MLIKNSLINVELLTSTGAVQLTRKHGPDPLHVFMWCQIIQHEQDGAELTAANLDMVAFFTGLDLEQVVRCLEVLKQMDFLSQNLKGWFIPSVVADLVRLRARRLQYSENGKKGGRPKRDEKEDENLIPESFQQHKSYSKASVLNTEYLTLNTEGSNLKEEECEKGKTLPPKKPLADLIEYPPSIDTKEVRQAVADFIEYRRQLQKPLTKFGLGKLIRSYAGRLPSDLCRDIDHSIKMGWQGVHPFTGASGRVGRGLSNEEKSMEALKSILEGGK